MYSIGPDPNQDARDRRRRAPQRWSTGNFCLKINTLYLYHGDDDELPDQFWILDDSCFVCQGDEIEERPNSLRIIPGDGPILNLSFPSSSDLLDWIRHLEAAKLFKADDFASGSEQGSTFQECFLATTDERIFLFNSDGKTVRNFRNVRRADLSVVKLKMDKKQAILRFCLSPDSWRTWKISFVSSENSRIFRDLLKTQN
jgi:hypothetical protein